MKSKGAVNRIEILPHKPRAATSGGRAWLRPDNVKIAYRGAHGGPAGHKRDEFRARRKRYYDDGGDW